MNCRYSLPDCHKSFRQPRGKSRKQITNKMIGLSSIRKLGDSSIALGDLFLRFPSFS